MTTHPTVLAAARPIIDAEVRERIAATQKQRDAALADAERLRGELVSERREAATPPTRSRQRHDR